MRPSRHVVIAVSVLLAAGLAFAGAPPAEAPGGQPEAALAPLFADAGCVQIATPADGPLPALDTQALDVLDLLAQPALSQPQPAAGGCNVGFPCTSPQDCHCGGYPCGCVNNRCKCIF